MQETVYMVIDKWSVRRLTKNMPNLSRGEYVVKLIVTVDEEAFSEPLVTKEVHVEDWRQGVDIADVDFKETVITEEEAAMVRQMRLEKMEAVLKAQGYTVTKAPEK